MGIYSFFKKALAPWVIAGAMGGVILGYFSPKKVYAQEVSDPNVGKVIVEEPSDASGYKTIRTNGDGFSQIFKSLGGDSKNFSAVKSFARDVREMNGANIHYTNINSWWTSDGNLNVPISVDKYSVSTMSKPFPKTAKLSSRDPGKLTLEQLPVNSSTNPSQVLGADLEKRVSEDSLLRNVSRGYLEHVIEDYRKNGNPKYASDEFVRTIDLLEDKTNDNFNSLMDAVDDVKNDSQIISNSFDLFDTSRSFDKIRLSS